MKYPVIWVNSDDDMFGVFNSEEELKTIPIGSENFYLGLILYSSDKSIYEVSSIRDASISFYAKLKNILHMQSSVNFELYSIRGLLSIEELKSELERMMVKNEEYWDSDGDMMKRLEKLRATSDFNEVVGVF